MQTNVSNRGMAFVHINKTGGTSILEALGLPKEHLTALEMRSAMGDDAWREAFTFSFVRNPWDKVVSHYTYRVLTNQTGLGDGHLSFPEWVTETYGKQNPVYLDNARMFMPQLRWITNEHGMIIVDFIGRFETIEVDFAVVCSKLGVTAELGHHNASSRGPYRDYYDATTKQIVADWFHEDITHFGYTF